MKKLIAIEKDLETMNPNEIKAYLEELAEHTKRVKKMLRLKIQEIPTVSLSITQIKCGKPNCSGCPHGYYVYANCRKDGKAKSEYVGKYGESSTFEKVKLLAADRPELIEMYEKLREKITDGVKIMQIIKNSNGKQYEILDTFEKYILLRNLSFNGVGADRYLVVYNLYPDGKSWQHGAYFETLADAVEDFEEKQKD